MANFKVDFSDLNFEEDKIKNMKVIDNCFYDGIVELREKSNKFYICCVWESSNMFTIIERFTDLKLAKKNFLKYKKRIA